VIERYYVPSAPPAPPPLPPRPPPYSSNYISPPVETIQTPLQPVDTIVDSSDEEQPPPPPYTGTKLHKLIFFPPV
jgi:hypothetical protein